MKKLTFLLFAIILYSCSSERDKIEKEKERIRIENEAKKEIAKEELDLTISEENKMMISEMHTQLQRFINTYESSLGSKTEIEKKEFSAQLEGTLNRIIDHYKKNSWLIGEFPFLDKLENRPFDEVYKQIAK
jgi:hypothetical protein